MTRTERQELRDQIERQGPPWHVDDFGNVVDARGGVVIDRAGPHSIVEARLIVAAVNALGPLLDIADEAQGS